MTLKAVKITTQRSAIVAIIACSAIAALACSSTETPAAGYWPDAYNPSGAPATYPTPQYHYEEDGHPGACLAGCHEPGGESKTLTIGWGGVVYQADGKTRAANVQVGVVSGAHKSFVYSRSDGLYWSEDRSAVDWNTADIRIRSANGEKPKLSSDERGADCDTCHEESGGSALPLTTW